jgi:hypothetical protein
MKSLLGIGNQKKPLTLRLASATLSCLTLDHLQKVTKLQTARYGFNSLPMIELPKMAFSEAIKLGKKDERVLPIGALEFIRSHGHGIWPRPV